MEYFNTFDGLQLAYRDDGTGLPILCLAGLTRDSVDFEYLVPHLAGVRMIRMDYRGRGASEWARDFRTYNVSTEARDAVALLDHLGIVQTAIIGTSRGGLVGMTLAATAKDRLLGVCLNDIGPEIPQQALDFIMEYVGRNPPFRTQTEMAAALPLMMPGFENVPPERWRTEAERRTIETPEGLKIVYDPHLRDTFQASENGSGNDMWPLFDALANLPVALIRGANSQLLLPETAKKMRERRPDLIFAEVPDRGHVPFLDEPEALSAIRQWIGKMT